MKHSQPQKIREALESASTAYPDDNNVKVVLKHMVTWTKILDELIEERVNGVKRTADNILDRMIDEASDRRAAVDA